MTFNNIPGHRSEPPQQDSASPTEGTAAFEGAALALGLPSPHPGVLTGLDGPSQAGLSDFASTADCLGLLGLMNRRGSVPVGEEQLGFLPPASSTVTPGHQDGVPFTGGSGGSAWGWRASGLLLDCLVFPCALADDTLGMLWAPAEDAVRLRARMK